ncbi:hydroxyacid dehydrogenase [Mangrovactinospora gilvigrisea]|uniref:Hydroxyacid dehydrogenase n=1 Tax=Mangrovactinospora gilvigrisea TaxID=1428644 RepID=A0A1J7BI51_9ACTN|nr:D-2-hydroxyacid dehydrogenase [Mangrovactinospora gilvigrisea]OIV38351.1 hydroxyacid dehydrogenase [Mangrovactinospora gilvigrisea]
MRRRLAGRAALETADGPAELAALLDGADALLAWDFNSDAVRTAWPRDPARAPRWVHAASAGVDRLMFPELVGTPGLRVTNSRGVFEQPIAEWVAGVVLAFAKDLPGSWERQRQRVWEHRETRRVHGSTALVVGAGPIGRAVGRTLRALGARVRLTGRRERADDPEFGRIHGSSGVDGEFGELLGGADWVVAAAPLTDATRGLFDAAAFARMRPGAAFVNVGRGPLVVEDDLLAALRSGTGRPARAALDVFCREPLPAASPLWEAPGLLVSPHMSGDAVGWEEELAQVFLAEFERWTADRPARNAVDLHLGYVPMTPQP